MLWGHKAPLCPSLPDALVADRAGVREIKLHAARHTCATLMHLQGVPTVVIGRVDRPQRPRPDDAAVRAQPSRRSQGCWREFGSSCVTAVSLSN